MTPQLARKIAQNLNRPDVFETLNEYLNSEIEKHQRTLVEVSDPIQIYRTQGTITALQQMLKLREYSLRVEEQLRSNIRVE